MAIELGNSFGGGGDVATASPDRGSSNDTGSVGSSGSSGSGIDVGNPNLGPAVSSSKGELEQVGQQAGKTIESFTSRRGEVATRPDSSVATRPDSSVVPVPVKSLEIEKATDQGKNGSGRSLPSSEDTQATGIEPGQVGGHQLREMDDFTKKAELYAAEQRAGISSSGLGIRTAAMDPVTGHLVATGSLDTSRAGLEAGRRNETPPIEVIRSEPQGAADIINRPGRMFGAALESIAAETVVDVAPSLPGAEWRRATIERANLILDSHGTKYELVQPERS